LSSGNDLSTFSEAQLLQAFVDNVQLHDTLEHIGRKNRLMDERRLIADELTARNDGSLQSLRRLLNHRDPRVCHSAAWIIRPFDHAAFLQTLRALAERDDNVGREARHSLETDEIIRRHQPSDQQGRATVSPAAQPSDLQIDSPTPSGMSRAEISRALADEFPADLAQRLLALARPAIGLWPQRASPHLAASASRLGGMPHAPPGWSWPLCETEPMFFLGQINCAELKGLPAAEKLPSTGLLAFFGDHDAVMSGIRRRDKPTAVYYWPEIDRLVPVTPPLELQIVFPLCGLAFYPFTDLPDPFSQAVEAVLPEEEQDWDYHAVWEQMREQILPDEVPSYWAFSKLFGWPHLQQGDLGNFGDPNDPTGFRLFLQIDSYSNGIEGAEFGDHGTLYFLIRDDDLRARRFDRCEFDMQCG